MKPTRANLAPWALGSAVAFVGVALARWAAPALAPGARIPVALAGFTVALLGLYLIARGVNRRLARQAAGMTGDIRPAGAPPVPKDTLVAD